LEFLDISKGIEIHRGAEFWHRSKGIVAGICKIIRDPETVENVTQTLTPVICVTSVDFMDFSLLKNIKYFGLFFIFLLILDSIVL